MLCEPYFLGGKNLELVFANKMPPSIAPALHSGQKVQMSDIESSQHDTKIVFIDSFCNGACPFSKNTLFEDQIYHLKPMRRSDSCLSPIFLLQNSYSIL